MEFVFFKNMLYFERENQSYIHKFDSFIERTTYIRGLA
jgi:hypothetical protein